jgi:hypothetical protein
MESHYFGKILAFERAEEIIEKERGAVHPEQAK